MPRRPSSASAASMPSATIDLGARVAQSARRRLRRDDHEHRRLVEGAEQLGIERQAGLAVEDDANRLPQPFRCAFAVMGA